MNFLEKLKDFWDENSVDIKIGASVFVPTALAMFVGMQIGTIEGRRQLSEKILKDLIKNK